jgi:hypothetical protein
MNAKIFVQRRYFWGSAGRSPAFDISHNLLTAARGRGDVCPDNAAAKRNQLRHFPPRRFAKVQRMARVVIEEQFVSFIC